MNVITAEGLCVSLFLGVSTLPLWRKNMQFKRI